MGAVFSVPLIQSTQQHSSDGVKTDPADDPNPINENSSSLNRCDFQIPVHLSINAQVVRGSHAILEYLEGIPGWLFEKMRENPVTVSIVIVGTTIVCVCFGTYCWYPQTFAAVITFGRFAISKCVTGFNKLTAFLFHTVLGKSIVGGSVLLLTAVQLYASWRVENAPEIDRSVKDSYPDERLLEVILNHEDEVLINYECPITLSVSRNPVRIQEGQRVHYYDQFWLKKHASKSFTSPYTKLKLPFKEIDDIVVDEEAKRIIEERLAIIEAGIKEKERLAITEAGIN